MLKKIISDGKKGADRAALDVALCFGIPHGGWISKEKRINDGDLPDKYQLEEMPAKNPSAAISQNIQQSDGTLIISRGPLEGDSILTRQLAVHHDRPWLHININKTFISDSIKIIKNWLGNLDIQILNVTGPPESEDPLIYQDTFNILKGVVEFLQDDIIGEIVSEMVYGNN